MAAPGKRSHVVPLAKQLFMGPPEFREFGSRYPAFSVACLSLDPNLGLWTFVMSAQLLSQYHTHVFG